MPPSLLKKQRRRKTLSGQVTSTGVGRTGIIRTTGQVLYEYAVLIRMNAVFCHPKKNTTQEQDGTGVILPWMGWDRSENQLQCHPLKPLYKMTVCVNRAQAFRTGSQFPKQVFHTLSHFIHLCPGHDLRHNFKSSFTYFSRLFIQERMKKKNRLLHL